METDTETETDSRRFFTLSVQGVPVQGVSVICPGGLCLGGLCPGRSLSGGSLSSWVFVLGVSVQGGLQEKRVRHPDRDPQYGSEWVVRILLECILVASYFYVPTRMHSSRMRTACFGGCH